MLRGMMRGALILFVTVAVAGTAMAEPLLVDLTQYSTGQRSTGNGLEGTGVWGNTPDGIKLSWVITKDANNIFTYQYTIERTAQGGVSHSLIETSRNFTLDDVLDGSSPIAGEPQWFYSSGSTGDSPNMPDGGIFGVKFNYGETSGSVSYTIVTARVPVWGDFYSKDGNAGGQGANAIWNTGFGTDPTAADAQTNFLGWIPTPDTDTIPVVPLPATVWAGLALFGLIGVGKTVRRRRELRYE